MGKFEPSTTLYFYKNTGVDAQNHPYFSSKAAQLSWYSSHLFTTFSAASYQREGQVVRVPMIAEDLRQCDMMCFYNAGVASRSDAYEFCRIMYVEFINPNTSAVHFKVDSWETYGTNVTIPECYVEREMVTDDWNGDTPTWKSLITEGINPGPQKVTSIKRWRSEGLVPVMLTSYDKFGEPSSDVKWGTGVPTTLNAIELETKEEMGEILKIYAQTGVLDGVAGIFMVPKEYSAGNIFDQIFLMDVPGDMDGYTPKNSKLYSSEFCSIEVTNLQGQSVFLKPELFGTFTVYGDLQFQVTGMFANGNGGFMCYPNVYAGISAAYDYAVSLYNNVQCAWAGDAFKNWMANNRGGMIARQVNNIVGGIQAAGNTSLNALQKAAGGDLAGAVLGAGFGQIRDFSDTAYNVVSDAISQIGTIIDQSVNRYQIQSLEYGNSIMAALQQWGFDIRFWTPTRQMAEVIDDFFNRFGYKVNIIKKPNLNTRPYWNYVKTSGCVITGGAPKFNLNEIREMFDSGVTFWNVSGGATIGDYSKDNRG